MYTTLNKIKSSSPCDKGWRTLLKGLGKVEADDEPLHLLDILRINRTDDALWSLRAFSAKECQLFAIGAARQVQHLCPDFEHLLNMAEAFVLQTPVNGVSPPSLSEFSRYMSAISRTGEWAATMASQAAWAAAAGALTEEEVTWSAWAVGSATATAAELSPIAVTKAACSYVESRIG